MLPEQAAENISYVYNVILVFLECAVSNFRKK
jgi:hypothetical protein